MSAPISMNKIIHGAVRRDLARFQDALDAFPDGDAGRAARLRAAWRYFYTELDHHHHGEHDIVWPALRQVGASEELLTAMDAEHDRLAEALTRTDAAFATLEGKPTGDSATSARLAVGALAAVADEHLQHEEADLDPIYLQNSDRPEIKAMGRRFARRRPSELGDFMAWLQNGATAEERSALRQNVPPPVVAILGAVFGRRYKREIAPVWC